MKIKKFLWAGPGFIEKIPMPETPKEALETVTNNPLVDLYNYVHDLLNPPTPEGMLIGIINLPATPLGFTVTGPDKAKRAAEAIKAGRVVKSNGPRPKDPEMGKIWDLMQLKKNTSTATEPVRYFKPESGRQADLARKYTIELGYAPRSLRGRLPGEGKREIVPEQLEGTVENIITSFRPTGNPAADQAALIYKIQSSHPNMSRELIIQMIRKHEEGGKINYIDFFKHGSSIHIKKKNRGKFTEYCNGHVTQECINRGKHSSNPVTRKRAIFAQNARHFKH